MKKLRIGVLLVLACLFVTACSCSKSTEKKYTITFDSNGGSAVDSQTVKEGGKVAEPTDPTRDGYTFDGWYLSLTDKEKYDFDTKVEKSFTLYAKWSKGSGSEEDDKKETDKKDEDLCKKTCQNGYELVNPGKADCYCKAVNVKATGVSLSDSAITLVVGQSYTVSAYISPSDATDRKLSWSTSNSRVATVSNGYIVAVGEGTAVITVTINGKSASVTVTVISQDQVNLNNAMASIVPKTISNGGTSLSYTSNGCQITSTSTPSKSDTIVSGETATTVYRDGVATTISSTYNVVCGSKSSTKTVTHSIPASGYTYTMEFNILNIIKVTGASNYSIVKHGNTTVSYYKDALGGAYSAEYTPGTLYDMTLSGDASTIYAVREA